MENHNIGQKFMTLEQLERELIKAKFRIFSAMADAESKCIGYEDTGKAERNVRLFPGELKDDKQEFCIAPVSDEYFAIKSCKEGKVLDIFGGRGEKGDTVILHPYHGNDNQLWRFKPLRNGNFMIVSKMNKLVLDIFGANSKDGTPLIVWEKHGGTNQQFRLMLGNASVSAGSVVCGSELEHNQPENVAVNIMDKLKEGMILGTKIQDLKPDR